MLVDIVKMGVVRAILDWVQVGLCLSHLNRLEKKNINMN